MSPNPPAQITVAFGRHFDGLIAIAHGDQWPWAHTALEQAGFTKRDDGSFHTPGDSVPVAMATLLPIARRHRATVRVSGRPYLGDIADQIAARRPDGGPLRSRSTAIPSGRKTSCPTCGTGATSPEP
ncbi:hypothetical protein ACFY1L_36100 [Streptomyces sp. NPDC001663]|uniref:hypothetical protein n=1 Tax=Streptomyces sp. NPDC001663 TaxID=3364597 RepID=UPI0036992B14